MRVLVMGLGRFGGGVAAARFSAERGDEVLVTDKAAAAVLAGSIRALEPWPVRYRLGGHDPVDFEWADRIFVNQAVAFDDPLVAAARRSGKEIVTELGVTLRLLKGPVVAVTGTKGKSTTTALTAAMLGASGVPAELGGNIGRPLLNEAARMAPGTVAVLEVSSFQLAWLEHDDFAPRAVVVTNVTGDHLDRHGSFEHYVRSKRRLVEALPPDGVAILREGDPVCAGFAAATRARVIWFGGERPAPVDLEGLTTPGRHNRANAAAAAHAALAVGATPEGCTRAARTFVPLPNRLESLGERRGILRVNDSIATTPEAAAAAVAAFDRPIVLLTGGRDKGLDWRPLLDAARRARAVVAYGETGPRLAEAIPGAHLRPRFDAAVRCALDLAREGDVLLLSPGFASYDEFPGFDARGARFRSLVDGAL
jgi:UDP-N-acetylmuramoylalanine--D-glutamate ligase